MPPPTRSDLPDDVFDVLQRQVSSLIFSFSDYEREQIRQRHALRKESETNKERRRARRRTKLDSDILTNFKR